MIGAAMPLIMSAYVGIADAAVEAALRSVRNRTDSHVLRPQLVGEMMNAHTTAADGLDAMFAASDDLRFDNTDEHAARTLSRKTVVAAAAIDTVRGSRSKLVGGAALHAAARTSSACTATSTVRCSIHSPKRSSSSSADGSHLGTPRWDDTVHPAAAGGPSLFATAVTVRDFTPNSPSAPSTALELSSATTEHRPVRAQRSTRRPHRRP